MANTTIYPYGVGGQTPSGISIVNDLVTGGADKALSAQQGVVIGDELYADLNVEIDTVTPSLVDIYIDANSGNWNNYQNHYKGKILEISEYKGINFKIGNKKGSSGNWFYRFAFLKNNTYSSGTTPSYSSVSPFTTQITVNTYDDSGQWYEGVVPNDANYIYIYAYNDQNSSDYINFPPDLVFYEKHHTNRLDALETVTTGLDDINDVWFEKTGANVEYEVVGTDCWHKQTIGSNGLTYKDNDATTVSCFPKSASKDNAVTRVQDCYSVDELPSNVLNLTFVALESGKWRVNVVEYASNLSFIVRQTYTNVDSSSDWKVSFTLNHFTKYFKLLVVKQDSNETDIDADQVTFETGFLTYTKGTRSQEGVPSRITKLENSVGRGMKKFSLCSYNIGHFSLGKSYDTFVSDQKQDLDYTNYGNSTPYSNYAAQKARWCQMLNEYSPDVLLMCEYIATFAHNQSGDVTTESEILSQYAYKSIGPLPNSTSYMRTAVFSNIELGASTTTYYTDSTQPRYYQCVDVNICGIDAKFVITHLDWNQGATGSTCRAAQIQDLITEFTDDDFVVICGDFNVSSASEFDDFITAGYTMANRGYLGDIPTSPSSGTKVWPSSGSKYVANSPTDCIDNIIVKGFAMSNIRVIDKKELSDHCGIMCDLTLINNEE